MLRNAVKRCPPTPVVPHLLPGAAALTYLTNLMSPASRINRLKQLDTAGMLITPLSLPSWSSNGRGACRRGGGGQQQQQQIPFLLPGPASVNIQPIVQLQAWIASHLGCSRKWGWRS